MSVSSLARAALTAFAAILLFSSTAYAQKWVKLAPFPQPAEEVYGISSGGKLYVFGGETRTSTMSGTFRKVEAYEPASNTWHTLPPMEFARHGLAGDFIGNRLHLVSGDIQSGGGPSAHIETEAHEALEIGAKSSN